MTPTPSPTILSQAQLDAIVQETIPAANIPAGHKNAVVGTIDQNGVQAVAIFSLGKDKNWQVSGVVRHDWTGQNEIGASVVASW